MTTAERAAAPLLPNLPVRRPDKPGQFAFADSRRVHTNLKESGWAEIDIRPIDVACTLPEKELVRYFTRLGPVGLILQEADDRTRTQVIETVRAAFDPFVHGAEVRYIAACWVLEAGDSLLRGPCKRSRNSARKVGLCRAIALCRVNALPIEVRAAERIPSESSAIHDIGVRQGICGRRIFV